MNQMIYNMYFIFLSITTLLGTLMSIQSTAVRSAINSVGNGIFAKCVYLNSDGKWTLNRTMFDDTLRDIFMDSLGDLYEPAEISLNFYEYTTGLACDEYHVICSAVTIKITVDYRLFVQEEVVSYAIDFDSRSN